MDVVVVEQIRLAKECQWQWWRQRFVDRNTVGDDIGKTRPMKDRIDDLPFSQDWPDRTVSSTLQRGFNPGEPRNNHLPPIHPFATRSLLLLESSAVWPGINVCRSPFLASLFLSLSFSLVPIFSVLPIFLFSHIRHRLNNTVSLLFLSTENDRKNGRDSYFSKSSRKLS